MYNVKPDLRTLISAGYRRLGNTLHLHRKRKRGPRLSSLSRNSLFYVYSIAVIITPAAHYKYVQLGGAIIEAIVYNLRA